MSEDENENENEMSLDEERKKLEEMGVSSTWDMLTNGEKKKKKLENKTAFRGFK